MKPVRSIDQKDLNQFEIALQETEKDFAELRSRFQEVCQAKREQDAIQAQLEHGHLPTAELKRLETQLETLAVTLESKLPSWESLKEPFWQALRFGGLGLVVGWLLRGWVG